MFPPARYYTTTKALTTKEKNWLRRLFSCEQSILSPPPKVETKPTTVLAYMIAAEILQEKYEETDITPVENWTDPYVRIRGMYHDDIRTVEIKGKKFGFTVSIRESYLPKTYKTDWAYIIQNNIGVSLLSEEKDIILAALHKSMIFRKEKRLADAEFKRQNDAVNIIEEWLGLV